jgi:hypothetical protein
LCHLVIRFKQEDPHWGYTRIRDYIVHLRYKIGETTVKNILLEHGFDPKPDLTPKTTWKEFIRSRWNVLAACDFFPVELLIKGKLVRCMVFIAIELSTRKVETLGIRPQPTAPGWSRSHAMSAVRAVFFSPHLSSRFRGQPPETRRFARR